MIDLTSEEIKLSNDMKYSHLERPITLVRSDHGMSYNVGKCELFEKTIEIYFSRPSVCVHELKKKYDYAMEIGFCIKINCVDLFESYITNKILKKYMFN